MTYGLEVRCSIQLSYRGIVERVGNIFQTLENRQADSNPMNSIPFSSERFFPLALFLARFSFGGSRRVGGGDGGCIDFIVENPSRGVVGGCGDGVLNPDQLPL